MMQYETLGGMSAVPMTYLIGRDGKVVEAWYGYREGQAEEALKKVGL
jgi:peroxiredoxin